MTQINYQALREAAEQAMPDNWGFDADLFHELVTPSIVLTLLDERERNQQYIKRRDQENEDIALTVGKLIVELEEVKSKLNEQREYYEGVIADGSKRIAELESNRATLAAEHGIQIAINELLALAPRLDKRAVDALSVAVEHLCKLIKKEAVSEQN
ncbi:TPA: ead/Ea22-like family protein [Escherichia coli]